MLLKIYEENPSSKQIQKVVECLNDGGVIIYPTDTVYGLGCSIYKPKAVERVAKIKGVDLKKTHFSVICNNLSDLSIFTKPLSNDIFKIMKKLLPGPYTFIVPASNNVPKLFMSKKKTVGIRIPENNIIHEIVSELGHPIMTTSIHNNDDVTEYFTNPELIYEKYKDIVDIVINGGAGGVESSTVLDCYSGKIEVVRKGKGPIDDLFWE